MQIHTHTLNKTHLISDTQLGGDLNLAVTQGRRSDFALMLALLSNDAVETTQIVPAYLENISDVNLRKKFNIPEPVFLTAKERDYDLCSKQADAFHQSGITSTRLNHCITPVALYFPAFRTHNLGEDVYYNLCGHQRRKLDAGVINTTELDPVNSHNLLTFAKRFQERQTQV
ncbi:VC2046/SO_2500 family protein [Candidatus Enterovibrio escicola]|uniref:VC2046/SO_2500 family protein n=1 Tax=Candidatus Enterovibrio escicola TaxID=1927127 RepID=UPI0012380AC1|nr:VC2046/SO_2500 family protein [Candidatus Enterovibrio escacola]